MIGIAHNMELNQEPLANIDAEAALLSAMMQDNRIAEQVQIDLVEEHFFEPVHQRIYAAILRMIAQGGLATPVTLRPLFEIDPAMKALGGPSYLAQLVGNSAVIIGARDFARQITDLAKRRNLLVELEQMRENIINVDGRPIEALVEGMDSVLNSTLQKSSSTRSLSIAQAFDSTIKSIEAEAKGETSKGVQIAGLNDWNALTGGMRKGELLILGARPGMGKTAVSLAVAIGAARAGHGTLFISIEMTSEELTKRAIADLCFTDHQAPTYDHIKSGNFNAFDRERLSKIREEIDKWPLELYDPSRLKIGSIAMQIRRYQRKMIARGQSLEFIVIDYLGLVKADDARTKRYEAVGEISRTMKEIAKECGVSIMLLAQLNRECEKREDKHPILSDLRDAGDIEQDADTVIFLYRQQYYLEQTEPERGAKGRAEWDIEMSACRDKIELIAAKRRNGKTGKRTCQFFGAHQAVRGSDYYERGL
jgi:replicative DNA helicase